MHPTGEARAAPAAVPALARLDAMDFDALVLAGGAAARLGGRDKSLLLVGGRSLFDRVVDSVAEARRVIVVGPPRATEHEVGWARERPPGGGPVAAIEAGLGGVAAATVVVVAADMPFLDRAVVAALVEGARSSDACMLRDAAGRVQPLAAAYDTRALRTCMTRVAEPAGASVSSLVASMQVSYLDHPTAGIDIDTWDDVAAARAAVGEE